MHDARPSSAGDSEGSSQPGTATGPRDFGNGAEHVLTRKAEEAVALRCPTWLLHSLAFTRCKISRAPYCVPTAVYSAVNRSKIAPARDGRLSQKSLRGRC